MRLNIKFISRTALLLALTLVIQLGGFPQPLTGPGVNLMLILSTIFAGPLAAVIIGSLTPIIAFVRGIMGFAPLVPYIAIGNAVYVLGFYYTSYVLQKFFAKGVKRNKLLDLSFNALGLVFGAVLKFSVLSLSVKFFVEAPAKVAQAMQLPQLITALTGGAIALVVATAIEKAGAIKKAQ